MKIAFQYIGGDNWPAGTSYLSNAWRALLSLGNDSPDLVLLNNTGQPPINFTSVASLAVETVTFPYWTLAIPDPWKSWKLPWKYDLRSKLRRRYRQIDKFGNNVLKQNGIDCVFSIAFDPVLNFPGPHISWIIDFQHLHLPKLFQNKEIKNRNWVFREYATIANLVLVSSQDVQHDFEKFAPDLASKGRVVPFVVNIPESIYEESPKRLLADLHLPEKFILIANQFWKHKNHLRVLEALRLLKQRKVEPVIVCTGNPVDYRDPQYLMDILTKTSLWDLRDQFIMLGIIKKEDVLSLMRQSICVLNPSSFEGFGFSLAESISLGKRALLSDLAVHREHNASNALYFDPNNIEDLADKIQIAWQNFSPGPDTELEATARAQLPERRVKFGNTLLDIAVEAVDLWRK